MKVHSVLGPGLLESAYEACLAHELRARGLQVLEQVPVPIRYEGVKVDVGFRLDLLVGGLVVVELKAIAKLLPSTKHNFSRTCGSADCAPDSSSTFTSFISRTASSGS